MDSLSILIVYETYGWLNILFAVCLITTIVSGAFFVIQNWVANEKNKYALGLFIICCLFVIIVGYVKLLTPYSFLVEVPDNQALVELSQHLSYTQISESTYVISTDNIFEKMVLLFKAKVSDATLMFV